MKKCFGQERIYYVKVIKEEYKNSLEIAVGFQVLVTNKSTGESFVDMLPYIPFNSNGMDEIQQTETEI